MAICVGPRWQRWGQELYSPQLRRSVLTAVNAGIRSRGREAIVKFLQWCILLVPCWPLALLALVLYPFV
jgi:hypothetical protein